MDSSLDIVFKIDSCFLHLLRIHVGNMKILLLGVAWIP